MHQRQLGTARGGIVIVVAGSVMCLNALAITALLAGAYVNPDVPWWYWGLLGLNGVSMVLNGFNAWVRLPR